MFDFKHGRESMMNIWALESVSLRKIVIIRVTLGE